MHPLKGLVFDHRVRRLPVNAETLFWRALSLAATLGVNGLTKYQLATLVFDLWEIGNHDEIENATSADAERYIASIENAGLWTSSDDGNDPTFTFEADLLNGGAA